MPTIADVALTRLENVLSKDKHQSTTHIATILKNDLKLLLENYFDIKSLDLDISPDQNGFSLSVFARAKHIKNFGILE